MECFEKGWKMRQQSASTHWTSECGLPKCKQTTEEKKKNRS